jgi:hypothetical protein
VVLKVMKEVEGGCPVGFAGLAVSGGNELQWSLEFVWWLGGGGVMLCCVSVELVLIKVGLFGRMTVWAWEEGDGLEPFRREGLEGGKGMMG